MLIANEPPFLFLHVDKAAGSSIQDALRPHSIPRTKNLLRRRLVWLGQLNRFLHLDRSLEFSEHVTARVVKRCLPPDRYARLFKFAFVRNPWDRLVSLYSYRLKHENHPRHQYVKNLGGFPEYLNWEIQRRKTFQHTYVCDVHGDWIVDFIGYFERLHPDFARVSKHLNVRAELPLTNVSSHRDYRDYYTPATRDLVATHFRHDIELFGYEFDGLPANAMPRGLKSPA